MPKPSTPRRDLYAEVTQKLVAAIEANPGDVKMPWRRTSGQALWRPTNALTGKHYRGINVVMLWGAAETQVTAEGRPLDSNQWATYAQWQEIGAQVRKGEKSSLIVKYGEYEVATEPSDSGKADDDGRRLYLKAYNVFNAAQVDNFALPEAPPPLGPLERIQAAETFVANTGATIVEGGERACYVPSRDEIHMPDEALFTGTETMSRAESYAAVKLHEALHWTSHASRLNRELGKRFGDHQYAAEELIAEIGSALICAELGVSQDVRADHAQYLAHWLQIMKADAKAIFTAAAAAERAADFLKGLQPPGADPVNDRALDVYDAQMRQAAVDEQRHAEPPHRPPDNAPANRRTPRPRRMP